MEKTAYRVTILRRFAAPALPGLVCLAAGLSLSARPRSCGAVEVSTAPLTVAEAYYAPRYRDPFVVSMVFGDEHAPGSRVAVSSVADSTFSVYNLSLTGIMEDSRAKEALLSDRSAGRTYVLKGGRLFDSKKKQVPGVSGVIKGKQVILMTSDKQVNQLNLRENE
ncbi:MAG TPA: hypothetical protein PL037_08400 [Elusimicrobiales bacterium]|nr:hypothetical protein [Elusimicrobiales bacterium]